MKLVEPVGKRSEVSIADMFDTEDARYLQSLARSAVYFCRCERHEEYAGAPMVGLPHTGTAQRLDDDDRSWLSNWRCAGHGLLATNSTNFDGPAVNRDSIEQITEGALRGWTPPDTDPRERERAMWLARLFYRVFNVDLANDIMRIAIDRSCDSDPRTRARTIHFLDETHSTVASWWAIKLLREHRELFADVPDPLAFYPQDKTIEDCLWRTTALVIGTQHGEFARHEALSGQKATLALYQVLARYDSVWFFENAGELARNARDLDMLRGQALNWLPDAEMKNAVRVRIDQASSR